MYRVPVVISIAILIHGILVGSHTASAQAATPEPCLPAASAPLGLAGVTLPNEATGIVELFGGLPTAVAGEPRAEYPDQPTNRVIAAYGTIDPNFGPPLLLQALNLATGDFFPSDFTVADFVASAAGTSDYDAQACGQDGPLVWVQAETTASVGATERRTPTASRVIHTLAWGNAESQWLFTAAAFRPEWLKALVSAFVAAAETQPATPTTEASPVAWWRRTTS